MMLVACYVLRENITQHVTRSTFQDSEWLFLDVVWVNKFLGV